MTVFDKEKHKQALSEQRDYEAAQESETATLGEAFVQDSREENAFTKLSRYETSMERSLYKAVHELQRRQAARPVPVAVDIDVSGTNTEKLTTVLD
jgi:hypothetical protein